MDRSHDCEEMSAPKRVQLRRTKGWRMPENTKKVTRPGPFGNPFKVHSKDDEMGLKKTAAQAVEDFENWLWTQPDLCVRIRKELRAKNLACFCKLEAPCHADVLLKFANEDIPEASCCQKPE